MGQKRRMDPYTDKGEQPEMPPCPVPELVDVLMDAGPRMSTGMGASALSAQELAAWCAGTHADLTPWEFGTVLAMSRGYAGEFEDATAPGRPAPWLDQSVEAQNAEKMRIARAAKAMLRG